jgi:exodeoxyribonuclease V beta subunit
LQNMIQGYEYERHFGGVMYLFLRGMSPSAPGNGVFSVLPDYKTLLRLDVAMRGNKDD